jgi:transglutaminase-like putative cysteine protease
MINYKVIHTTIYNYSEAVSFCYNIARLGPRDTDNQTSKGSIVNIFPQPDVLCEYEDFFGNKLIYFAIQHEHKSLKVTVTSEVTRNEQDVYQHDFNNSISWETASEQLALRNNELLEVRQFIPETDVTKANAEITEYALQSFTPGKPMFDAVYNLMQRIHEDFIYKAGFTTIATPLAEVMKARKGVCQDFAHLAIACIRSVGLPARYVSGYIETISPQGTEKLVGVDASHAWFAVYIPGIGWVDFDPTNNQIPSTQHITIGWARDYFDIAPLKGVILSSGSHTLSVSVDMRRVN